MSELTNTGHLAFCYRGFPLPRTGPLSAPPFFVLAPRSLSQARTINILISHPKRSLVKGEEDEGEWPGIHNPLFHPTPKNNPKLKAEENPKWGKENTETLKPKKRKKKLTCSPQNTTTSHIYVFTLFLVTVRFPLFFLPHHDNVWYLTYNHPKLDQNCA